MQQWEDWRPGYDWRLLAEKTTATLLVVSITVWLWRVIAAWRREAPAQFQVEIPSQLNGLATESKRDWPSDEVSSGVAT